VAGGNATLDATLEVRSLGTPAFHPSAGDAFEVLHTGGTVAGNFSTLDESTFNTLPGVLPGRLELRPIEVEAKNAVFLIYVAVPPNEELPDTGTGNERPPIVLDPNDVPPVNPEQPLPPTEAAQLLDPTAEQLTSLYQITFSGADMQRFSLGDRMFQIQQGSTGFVSQIAPTTKEGLSKEGEGKEGKELPPAYQPSPQNRWGIWISGSGNWVDIDSTSNALGYNFTAGTVSLGADYQIIPGHLAVGIFGAYSHTRADLLPSGDVSASTGRGGLYATYWNEGWYVDAAVWGGGSSYSTSREAVLGSANGDTSGPEFSTFGEAGYDFHVGNFAFGPTVAMQYTYASFDSFSEHGSLVPLNIHGNSQNSLITDVGGRMYFRFHVGNLLVIPSVNLAWEREYEYFSLPLSVTAPELNNASTTVFGPNLGRDSLIINANVSIQINPRLWLTLGYDGQQGRNNYNANGVSGTISFSF
jgi:outer membrane autotransporter protein